MARNTTFDSDLSKDTRESYANVAAYGQSKISHVGTLQRLAKSFLKWDKWAEKAERRDLQRFATFSLTQENCNVATMRSFQDCFARALASSGENDRSDAEYLAGEMRSETSHQNRRAAFTRALEAGATEATIKDAMGG